MSDTSSPSPRPIAGTAVAVAMLVVAAAIFIVVDPVLAWDDNEFVGRGRLFLYFTAQANLLAVASLVVVGVGLLRGRAPSRGVELLRGLAVVDMAITGIVSGALLADPAAGFDVSEFVLHQAGPLLMVAWWIAMPPAQPLRFGVVGLWLLHPLLWTASILMYAAESSDHWVPYFFLDPAQVDGVGGVVLFVAIIHVVVAVLGVVAVLVSRARWSARVHRALGVGAGVGARG